MLKVLDKPTSGQPDRHSGLCVRDVIAALEKFDPATPVVIGGQYGGFVDVRALGATGLCLNVNSAEGFGPHDLPGPDEVPQVEAVVLVAEAAA